MRTAQQNVNEIIAELGDEWLPQIYQERVLKLRTRSYHFEVSGKHAKVAVQHTLLGVELKIGKRRLLCPDLANARYLSLFARAGCSDVAVPYDITKVSQLADQLESSWHRMLLLVERDSLERTSAFRARVRGLLIARLREAIAAYGAGMKMPEFKHSTKQRR